MYFKKILNKFLQNKKNKPRNNSSIKIPENKFTTKNSLKIRHQIKFPQSFLPQKNLLKNFPKKMSL